ncbi:MAG TPA: D-2-hydroxyacid dehydrogenase [Candidatus Coproplasma excrementipullorum]|nr:D-2-hydroxyacid dehydrogenase [Candidatus Coproplasma excrementipullorum]
MDIVSVDLCTLSAGDIDFCSLEKLGDVTYYDTLTPGGLARAAGEAEALLVNKAQVDEALLSACPRLKFIGIYATGYNNVDLAACRKRGVTVCNVPGYSTHAVAQHVFALLLMFCGAADKYAASVYKGDWKRVKTFSYMPWQTHEVFGKTFGVYGYGNIGRAVARIAEAMGMEVIVCTRTPPADCPYEQVSSDEIFARSDFLSLHCPLTESTAGLVNARTLALMKEDAVLINTARGGLVDERALASALNSERLGGACLDVIAAEPMKKDCPLFRAKHCIITPHVAWVPRETRQRLVEAAAYNLKCFIEGRPVNVVNS